MWRRAREAPLIERSLRQNDLVPVFRTESILSEVLSGKRELHAKHIRGLADFLHGSPAVFFAPRVPQLA